MQPEREGTKASDGRTRGTFLSGARGMALPVRPYRPQRCIHQKLHPNDPNPTKMFEHLQYLQCEPRRTTSAVEVQHGSSPQTISPAALHPSEASPQSTHMFKHLPCSSIFNAMAFPLRPYHPRRFIHQKLHANQTKMVEHLQYLQCEAHRTISAVEVQHGSSNTKALRAQAHSLPTRVADEGESKRH